MARRPQYDFDAFRRARRQKGLTQSAVAHSIGATQSAVSMFESGRSDVLADDRVLAMAAVLGVEVSSSAPAGRRQPADERLWKYCPAHDCPSHVAYVSAGRACLMIVPVETRAGEASRCALCGEVLESHCPNPDCGAPVSRGAFCSACGTAYVSAPPEADADAHAFVRARGEQLRDLHTLAGYSSALTTRGTDSFRAPPPSSPETIA